MKSGLLIFSIIMCAVSAAAMGSESLRLFMVCSGASTAISLLAAQEAKGRKDQETD
jgi:hypothetical protein